MGKALATSAISCCRKLFDVGLRPPWLPWPPWRQGEGFAPLVKFSFAKYSVSYVLDSTVDRSIEALATSELQRQAIQILSVSTFNYGLQLYPATGTLSFAVVVRRQRRHRHRHFPSGAGDGGGRGSGIVGGSGVDVVVVSTSHLTISIIVNRA